MKRRIFILALLLSLTGCSSVQLPEEAAPRPVSSTEASGIAVSSEASSSEAESEPESVSSEDSISSEPEVSSKPAESEPAVSSEAPAPSQPSVSSQSSASSEPPPVSSEAAPPPVFSEPAPSQPTSSGAAPSQAAIPEGRRPMTEAEVDEVIAEAIAYAESKGMTWYEDFSIEKSGYYNPANSTFGKEIFRKSLLYHVDQLYEISTTESYYEEGNAIYYKIVKVPIEGQ